MLSGQGHLTCCVSHGGSVCSLSDVKHPDHVFVLSSEDLVESQICIPRKHQLQPSSLQTAVTVASFSLADVVLEKAMHKCILKPLKGHVEAMLKDFHTADGSWKQLKENLQLVRQRNPQELGVFAPTPDLMELEKIKLKFMTMQKMYSPEKKVMLLLRVCKLIYTVMENNSGEAACHLVQISNLNSTTRSLQSLGFTAYTNAIDGICQMSLVQ